MTAARTQLTIRGRGWKCSVYRRDGFLLARSFPHDRCHLKLTTHEWRQFIRCLRDIRVPLTYRRRNELLAGFNFDTGKKLTLTVRLPIWELRERKEERQERGRLSALYQRATGTPLPPSKIPAPRYFTHLPKRQLHEAHEQVRTGIFSDVVLFKGCNSLYVPRKIFLALKQAGLRRS